MKKLNRKGFTLIELLAIIVILAIILVIAIPEILDTMDNSRVSSLHSSAKGVSNWWEQALVSDTLQTDNNKKLVAGSGISTSWQCIASLHNEAGKSLFDVAELSANDINNSTTTPPSGASFVITTATCSAVRFDSNGKVEVLLIANPTGKFKVADYTPTYAFSGAANGMENPYQP